jgi:hypothetical protein
VQLCPARAADIRRDRLADEIRDTTPEAHGEALRKGQERWIQVIRGAGLKPE